jgi:hypothetical protein
MGKGCPGGMKWGGVGEEWGGGSGRSVEGEGHGRMNYKDTKPYMSAFLSVDLLTDFAAFCLTDFIDWRYTHSWIVFSTKLVNCCPPWMLRNYTCVLLLVAPLLYLLSDLLPPPPSPLLPNVQYIQTMCDCGGGGG